MSQPAFALPVKTFHHILLWPLLMRGKLGTGTQALDPFVSALAESGWTEVEGEGNAVHKDFTYEEVVYFHPFVRDFLFGDGKTPKEERAVRRFTRKTKPSALEVTLEAKSEALKLRVERVELFLIRPRVAVLMIEVSNRIPGRVVADEEPKLANRRTELTLAQVLLLQSRLRHIYPPYFDKHGAHGDCPLKVEWKGLAKPAVENLTCDTHRGAFDKFVIEGAEPPVYDHWRALFCDGSGNAKIKMMRTANDRELNEPCFQQLLDDRMPGLSFIAVDDPKQISPADEDRLPAFDPPSLSYEEAFNADLRDSFRYTRFRHWDTTYYCNGTSFAAVVNTAKSEDGSQFSDVLLGHFRRHYTHLALLAHYQHAALLYFADELAESAKKDGRNQNRDWRDEVRQIQHRFLKFRTRSYFTEVSNQIQGKDLFSLWLHQLGTEALFERVSETCEQVYDAMENQELKDLTIAQKDLATSQTELAQLAQKGLVITIGISLAAALFSWASLFPDNNKTEVSTEGPPCWALLWLLIGVLGAAISMSVFLSVSSKREPNPKSESSE